MQIAAIAQILSSLATFAVATLVLLQTREQRKARHDQDRPQIIVDVDYTGRATVNLVVRNIGTGAAKDIEFEFSAPIENSNGFVVSELPYFQNGVNFMAPQTDLVAVWDDYQNVVQMLRNKGLTEGITITSKYKDLEGESYETHWTINPLLLEGSGYFDFRDFEDQVQALEDQARTLEKLLQSVNEVINRRQKDGESA